MIDTIIFDVGRVLVNWDYESYLKRFAFGPEKTKAITAATFESPYWRQFDRGILTPEEIVKGFCSLAPEYTEEIKEVFAHCEETITPLPYAESWVRSLKEKGYRLYILSNYSGDLFERTKEKMPFLPYMDGTLFSYTCHLTKPEPEIYQHLIQKFSLTPDRCVFLDDTKANVEAAEQAGIHGIHFTGDEDIDGLDPSADYTPPSHRSPRSAQKAALLSPFRTPEPFFRFPAAHTSHPFP